MELEQRAVVLLQDRLLRWYAEHGRDLPWRRTRSPYAILVSEIMLQQTQVRRVIPRYDEWLRRYPRLEDLAAARLDDVLRAWQGLGYNNRARRLRDCATRVCAAADGDRARLPRAEAALRTLPGIGPYTARALLVFAHNDDVAAVDTNVRRVLAHELALPQDLPAAAVQGVAEAVLPRGRSRDWHNALMDYGAMVLTSRATGVRSSRRQEAFVGSRRWQRARLLRVLLDSGPRPVDELAALLALPVATVGELVDLLERDGLIVQASGGVRVA